MVRSFMLLLLIVVVGLLLLNLSSLNDGGSAKRSPEKSTTCDVTQIDNHFSVMDYLPARIVQSQANTPFALERDYAIPSVDALNLGTADFSFNVWFRADQEGMGTQVIFDKRYEAEYVQGLTLYIYGGNLGFQLADGDGWTNYVSDTPVLDGRWHMATVTVERQNPQGGRMYLDQELVYTFNPTGRTGSLDNVMPLYLGQRSSSDSGYFLGDVQQFNFYDCLLSPRQIQMLYRHLSQSVIALFGAWVMLSLVSGYALFRFFMRE